MAHQRIATYIAKIHFTQRVWLAYLWGYFHSLVAIATLMAWLLESLAMKITHAAPLHSALLDQSAFQQDTCACQQTDQLYRTARNITVVRGRKERERQRKICHVQREREEEKQLVLSKCVESYLIFVIFSTVLHSLSTSTLKTAWQKCHH